MAAKAFDRKFGANLLEGLPTAPGVYLFKDGAGEVLYVGKAKDLRRRLQSYRNASRRKVHRKMRMIVREASSLEVRLQPSEQAALLVENELILALRPTYNVDGAYDFLYPAVGIAVTPRHLLLCFTTSPDAWQQLGLQFFGVFRSRLRTRAAFDALVELLALLGHLEPRKNLPIVDGTRGSRLVGIRQLDPALAAELCDLWSGKSDRALRHIATMLLDKPRARRNAADVQEQLDLVAEFHVGEARELASALRSGGREGSFVPQQERDALLIKHRSARAAPDGS